MAQNEPLPDNALRDAPVTDFLGFVRYSGRTVETGLMDARKAAHALAGLDECVRFFVAHQAPELASAEYEVPVLVRPGSWEALIPQTIVEWIAAGAGLVVTTYLATAAKKAAEHDFANVGIKDVFTKALQAIQWLIRIGKHLGQLTKRQTDDLRWRKNNEEVGLLNEAGEYLYVPRVFYSFYLSAPPHLLAKLASVVGPERRLVVGVIVEGNLQEEEVRSSEKAIFTGDEADDDILFPELTHGMPVALDGFVTRGNATANTLGFRYRDHILTCQPFDGSIVMYKAFLFAPAQLIGVISRETDNGGTDANRPRIIFNRIEPLDTSTTSLPLFPDSGDEERT